MVASAAFKHLINKFNWRLLEFEGWFRDLINMVSSITDEWGGFLPIFSYGTA